MTVAFGMVLAIAFPALLVALIERQLDRHTAHDRLDQCADEHNRPLGDQHPFVPAENSPFHNQWSN